MKDYEIASLKEKGDLINEAIKIIDRLGENDLADMDGEFTTNEFNSDELQRLIIRARGIKGDRWWDELKNKRNV